MAGAYDAPPGWTWLRRPRELFPGGEAERYLKTLDRVLARREGSTWSIGVPWEDGKEFPLPAFFCFSALKEWQGQYFWLFSFDLRGWPVYKNWERTGKTIPYK